MSRHRLTLDAPARARLERWLILGGLVAAALLLLGEWLRVSGEPLAPDADTFRGLARDDLHTLFDTGHREPLHVWLMRGVLWAWGENDAATRGVSVALYGAALGIYYATTRALFGRGFAAVCFFFFALSRKNAALAVEGLRNFEVVIALCLVALAGRRAAARPGSARAHALVGLAVGLGALSYLSLFLVTQAWLWGTRAYERVAGRWSVLALAIPLALVFPHLANNKQNSGDWFDSLDRHVRFYRNLEYKGRPGMPTAAEVEEDPYAGPRVTGLQYVLEGRSPGEIAWLSVEGAFRWATYRAPSYEAYRTETFAHFGVPLWAATVAGGVLIVARKRRFLWVPWLVACCGIPFVFLLGAHQLDGRLLNDYLFAWLWLLVGWTQISASPPGQESLSLGPETVAKVTPSAVE